MAGQHHPATHDDGHSEGGGHIVPLYVYASALGALLFLTIITVAASRFDFGSMNLVVALAIASVKAGIVGLFFMHLKYENPLIWLFVIMPLILLGILLAGVFADSPTRAVVEPVKVVAER